MKGKDDSVHEMGLGLIRKAPVREHIAEEAADWFVANREGLDNRQSAEFAAWLRAAPQNIEEYLNVAWIGRDLRGACNDPEVPFDELMKRALAVEDPVAIGKPPEPPQSLRRSSPALPEQPRWRPQPWLSTALAVAAIGAITLAFLFWKGSGTPRDSHAIAYNIRTGHGQLLTHQLPDSTVLELDTDSWVSVRFDSTQRVVRVLQGRAEFKVAHEPKRKFVVEAGDLGITDVGTVFDVYALPHSTVITVLEGRVAVAPEPKALSGGGQEGSRSPAPFAPVEVAAGQQVRIENSWPPIYTPIDTQRATAWLRRQIVFENEPLEAVTAEFNRYSTRQIEIESPALRTLAVSGVFAADDSESFIAFLRSLDGVQVEVTATQIRVSRK